MSGVYHKSAEELQLLRRKLTQTHSPYRSGPKDCVPDGSEEQAEKLQKQFEQYEELLSEERILRKGNMSVGKWNRDKKLAEVEINKGVHWQVFGKTAGGKIILQPEEALYMVDHGMLELYYCDLPMSLQQVYEVTLSEVFPLHHYVVYSYLRNLGFIVLRHERRMLDELDDNVGDTTVKKAMGRENVVDSMEDVEENVQNTMEEKIEDMAEKEETQKDAKTGNGREETKSAGNEVQMAKEHKEETEEKLEDKANVKMEENAQEEWDKEKTEERDEKVDQETQRDIAANSQEDSPVLHYWKDEKYGPLVHPNDATSLENILKKLHIIKSRYTIQREVTTQPSTDLDGFKITFDVYQPQKKFKKTEPGLPNYCLCICKFSDSPPSIAEITSLAYQSYPVPLKYAVVDGKDVSFYSFCEVQLPTYLET